MFAAGFDGALEAMATAERLLRQDGVLVFKAEIAAGASPHPNFLDAGLLGKDGLTAQGCREPRSTGYGRKMDRARAQQIFKHSRTAAS